MALEGTLRDFSLADIFQLISIQRKTGVLTLKNKGEVVTVSFLNGNVVSADSLHKNLEDRLGTVLAKSGRITDQQLRQALRVQKNTLQRLGYVLVKEQFISQDDLRQALQLQVTQIVYRLFRWKDGDYHFSQEESLDYDRENFTPVSAQSILMEGIRMIDEWPILERRIRSSDTIFEWTDPNVKLEAVDSEEDLEFDEGSAPEKPGGKGSPVRVTREQLTVYGLVDGRTTVKEMVDRTNLGDFETYRNLYELLERKLIREARVVLPVAPVKAPRPAARRGFLRLGYLLLALVGGVSLATMPRNPVNYLPLPFDESPMVDAFKRLLSRNRIDRIDHALHMYFLKHHRFAPDLSALVSEPLLPPEAILDPWGRPYHYEILPEGYRIVGFDNGGVEDSSLTRTRRFPPGLLLGEIPVFAQPTPPASEPAREGAGPA